jgi:hypothetical protein
MSLKKERIVLQNDLKSLYVKQSEFNRQIAEQQRKLARAKADTRTAAAPVTSKRTHSEAQSSLQGEADQVYRPMSEPPDFNTSGAWKGYDIDSSTR